MWSKNSLDVRQKQLRCTAKTLSSVNKNLESDVIQLKIIIKLLYFMGYIFRCFILVHLLKNTLIGSKQTKPWCAHLSLIVRSLWYRNMYVGASLNVLTNILFESKWKEKCAYDSEHIILSGLSFNFYVIWESQIYSDNHILALSWLIMLIDH